MAIRKACYNCSGTGTITPPSGIGSGGPYECSVCDGIGKLVWGSITLPDGLFYTYKILENTDPTEYQNLSDANKANYNTILSLGTVDLSDGTVVKATLWILFDAQSTTRADLITMIGS